MRKGLFYIVLPLFLRCMGVVTTNEEEINKYYSATRDMIKSSRLVPRDSIKGKTWMVKEFHDGSLMIYGPIDVSDRAEEIYLDGPDGDKNLDELVLDGTVIKNDSRRFKEAANVFEQLRKDYENVKK